MTNNANLTKALSQVAPKEAGRLGLAARAARDARRQRGSDELDDVRVPVSMAARLRAEGREDSNREVKRAQKKAKRAAKAAALELNGVPSSAEIEKFATYHQELMAQVGVVGPFVGEGIGPDNNEIWDVKAESLARRARNEVLQKAARAAEDEAKADWVERTGGKSTLGVGFRGHGREEAGRDAPLPLDQEADAAALEEFRRLAESGQASWLEPREPFDPLAGHGNARANRKDARAAKLAAGAHGQGRALSANRKQSDKPNTQPPPTRGGR